MPLIAGSGTTRGITISHRTFCVSLGFVSNSAVTIGAGAGVYAVGLLWFSSHRAKRHTARWIVPRLHRTAGPIRVPVRSGTWNPAEIGSLAYVNGRGHATYEMDESGIVHLTLQSRHGPDKHFSGPTPEALMKKPEPNRQRWIAITTMGATVAGGFALGYILASGSVEVRLLWACLGLAVGWLVLWLVTLIWQVARSVRAVGKRRTEGLSHEIDRRNSCP